MEQRREDLRVEALGGEREGCRGAFDGRAVRGVERAVLRGRLSKEHGSHQVQAVENEESSFGQEVRKNKRVLLSHLLASRCRLVGPGSPSPRKTARLSPLIPLSFPRDSPLATRFK